MGRLDTHSDSNKSAPDSKKKTPTQLRRERKKRQKERERRQKELEQQRLIGQGEDKQRRIATNIDSKTSSSTSRTTSPLSSIGNTGSSDTQIESGISLSLSQTPPPLPPLLPATNTTSCVSNRTQGDKAMLVGGNSQCPDTVLTTCNRHDDLSSSTVSENENTTVSEDPSVTVGTMASLPTKRNEDSSSEIVTGDKAASIEWDMSQRRHKGVNEELSSSSQHSTCSLGNHLNHNSSSYSHIPPRSSSDVHILEPKLPAKRLKDIMCLSPRLQQNESDPLLAINSHEE